MKARAMIRIRQPVIPILNRPGLVDRVGCHGTSRLHPKQALRVLLGRRAGARSIWACPSGQP